MPCFYSSCGIGGGAGAPGRHAFIEGVFLSQEASAEDRAKLDARNARFGEVPKPTAGGKPAKVAKQALSAEEEEKLKKRQERFTAASKPADPEEEARRAARMSRFAAA